MLLAKMCSASTSPQSLVSTSPAPTACTMSLEPLTAISTLTMPRVSLLVFRQIPVRLSMSNPSPCCPLSERSTKSSALTHCKVSMLSTKCMCLEIVGAPKALTYNHSSQCDVKVSFTNFFSVLFLERSKLDNALDYSILQTRHLNV